MELIFNVFGSGSQSKFLFFQKHKIDSIKRKRGQFECFEVEFMLSTFCESKSHEVKNVSRISFCCSRYAELNSVHAISMKNRNTRTDKIYKSHAINNFFLALILKNNKFSLTHSQDLFGLNYRL